MTPFVLDKVIELPAFSPTFTLQGQIYHRLGHFFQVIINSINQVYRRGQYIEGVERDIVFEIRRMLHRHNCLVNIFKSVIDNWPSDNYKE